MVISGAGQAVVAADGGAARWSLRGKKYNKKDYYTKKRMCLWEAHSLSYNGIQMDYFLLSARSISTAIETVAPTIGLLPIPRKPIIST